MMLGIISRRFVVLLLILLLAAALFGSYIGELTLVNGSAIVAGFIADFLRYCLALLTLLIVASNVAEDYEFRQFERLLTMPLARWQYIAAQTLLIACLCAMMALPAALLIAFYSDLSTGMYWAAGLWMELFLLGLLSLLAILSLEKIPQAVFFALTVYLFAKLSGLITLIVAESVKMSEGSVASRTIEFIFNAILYLIPGLDTFADNNVFFVDIGLLHSLGAQLLSVVVYGAFLVAVCLVDFYRKEFNL
jgi:hypothetical protein